jgi:hypothetical protein
MCGKLEKDHDNGRHTQQLSFRVFQAGGYGSKPQDATIVRTEIKQPLLNSIKQLLNSFIFRNQAAPELFHILEHKKTRAALGKLPH